MKLYSIFDRKALTYSPLLMEHTDGTMSRSLHQNLKGQQVPMALYPEDFEVYWVGEFDPQSGEIVGVGGHPRLVCSLAVVLQNGSSGDA